MVNYHGSQKAVVRVNPLLPLQDLVPVICDKCEFDPAFVVLLKDSIGRHELPLDKSLSQLGIKELYVHDKSLGNLSVCDSFYTMSTEVRIMSVKEKHADTFYLSACIQNKPEGHQISTLNLVMFS